MPAPRVMFSMAMWMAAMVAPIQILAGDQHGLNTLKHQPAKVDRDGRPFREPASMARRSICSVCPTTRAAKVKYAIEVPKLVSR
jgi:cytochrome d ubiquinol oxidase subunit I